jgi:16S rRNA (uracil1498-N3)-methyltransferase
MPLHRVFCPDTLSTGTTIALPAQAAEHVTRVLRLRAGDAITVFDGSGIDYAATIGTAARRGVMVTVGPGTRIHRESPLDLTLLQGVSRGPRMDAVIQKATELGVTRVLPVVGGRSVVRLGTDRAESRREHWQRVAIGACEQSGRSVVPSVLPPGDLTSALATLGARTRGIVLDPGGDRSLAEALAPVPALIAVAVGPEGGFSDDEISVLERAGFARVRLGPRILRTETAPVVALALIQQLAGDLARPG